MKTIQKNTIFTNVACTTDGRVYWEGLNNEIVKDVQLVSWKGKKWTKNSGEPAAHPNSRFCVTIENCPIKDPEWNNPEGLILIWF
jgi:phosphoenolpyruvate carboxykinase (GTP)